MTKLPFVLSEEEVKNLHDFLMRVGYISYEYHLLIIVLVRKLDRYIAEIEEEE